MTECKCGSEAISSEVRTPGKNRGRWYFRCPTGTCSFFKWDNSPLSFIKHPTEAYKVSLPLSGHRVQPSFNFRNQTKDAQTSLTKTKVRVVFSVISQSLIGIKAESNLTLDPVIASIDRIQWNDEHDQWTIPASVPMYNLAIATLPTDTPNLQIEIEPIPPALLDSIIETTLLQANAVNFDTDRMNEVELKWSEFVESSMWSILTSNIQKEAVRVGIERKGRILLGNENGIGSIAEALALTKVYQDQWPVLVTCPTILCQTWKEEIKYCLGLDDDEVCILDPKVSKSDMFSEQIIRKRKKAPKTSAPKIRQPYKKRMQQRLQADYESSSSSEDEEEQGQENGVWDSDIKFYIASHEHTAKCRIEIAQQKFKIMLCADSHYLKSWTKGESKFICKLLQDTEKVILISDLARNAKPVNLFTQLQAIAPTMFPKFEVFVKRYCDCKSTVFGYNYDGKCNEPEFTYLLDTNIWFCPRLPELKAEFPDFVKQTVLLTIKKNTPLRRDVEHLLYTSNVGDEDEKTEIIHDLHKRTSEAKKDDVNAYIDYALETNRRPKIAIAYYNQTIFDSIEAHLISKRVKFTHIDDLETANEKCDEYNVSHKVQIVILDMKVEDLNISLHSVDLATVIFAELPFEMSILSEVESLFKFKDRKGPLSLKYLIAPDSIDDYLWPIVKST